MHLKFLMPINFASMTRSVFIIVLMISVNMVFGQGLEPYTIFNEKGKSVKFKKVLKQAEENDIVLFGLPLKDARE